MKFRLGELFSGSGGLAYGAKIAKVKKEDEIYSIEHAWANDIDEESCITYRNNICPSQPESVICKPVENLDINELSEIEAFAYGFPCNDFSIVGEHNGLDGKYGGLFSYGIKVIDSHNPLWFVAENVGGLRSANEGKAFEIILNELFKAGLGYKIVPHLYKFEEYGVPQTRHRIIIIGIRQDLNLEFKVPAPTTPETHQYISVRDALENPPIPINAPNQTKTKQSPTVIERLKHIPPGKNAWYDGIPEHLRLNVKGAKMSQIYRRLDPNYPSYTITGSGGGGTHGYHWDEPRALTNRERARIQTFPDDYVFYGKKESIRKQIGMAVPPEGMKIIFEAILKTFADLPYPAIKGKWQNEMQENKLQMELVFLIECSSQNFFLLPKPRPKRHRLPQQSFHCDKEFLLHIFG